MIPNIITALRIVSVPVVLALYFLDWIIASVVLMAFLLISDFFDGIIARRFNQASDLGALLDPVADKVTVLAFFPFLGLNHVVPLWFVVLVVVRDVAQLLSIPILSWILKIEFKVKPSQIAKTATALNFFIIGFAYLGLLYGQSLSYLMSFTLWGLIPVTAFLEVYILVTYIPRFVQIARGAHDTFE